MNIGIIGLGLIGGSLGWDLRVQGFRVLGVSRREETCQQALALGIVDRASMDLSLLRDADFVFLCTPLSVIVSTFKSLISYLSPDVIVTDVGSVKTSIVRELSSLWPHFVGGHPMAGSEYQGLDGAQRDLFVGRPYVITPLPTTSETTVTKVRDLAQRLGATVYQCSPEEHDRAVAWISHLPVMVSASLISACLQENHPEIRRFAELFASSGFRDTSRVGGGNPELGVMMARFNREELLRTLGDYRQQLDQLITDIEQENWLSLEEKLTATHHARKKFVK